jgi:hypothetical protein
MPGRTYPLKVSFTLAKIRFVVDLQTVFVINMKLTCMVIRNSYIETNKEHYMV